MGRKSPCCLRVLNVVTPQRLPQRDWQRNWLSEGICWTHELFSSVLLPHMWTICSKNKTDLCSWKFLWRTLVLLKWHRWCFFFVQFVSMGHPTIRSSRLEEKSFALNKDHNHVWREFRHEVQWSDYIHCITPPHIRAVTLSCVERHCTDQSTSTTTDSSILMYGTHITLLIDVSV